MNEEQRRKFPGYCDLCAQKKGDHDIVKIRDRDGCIRWVHAHCAVDYGYKPVLAPNDQKDEQ